LYDLGHRTFHDITPGLLTVTDMCIMYHLTNFEASRNVILHMRYISTCVGAQIVCVCGGGGGWGNNEQKLSAVAHVILTCDMYKSSRRHIHDPVLYH
jgi:hypothetical protein